MKKLTNTAQSYKAGAKAYLRNDGSAKNPHSESADGHKSWEHGYLDRQKLNANSDGDASRKRAMLRIARIH
jgi:hypothetical protein